MSDSVNLVSTPISRYPVPNLDDLPADILERILAVQEKAKFIPNVFLALAYRPAEFRAFLPIMMPLWSEKVVR